VPLHVYWYIGGLVDWWIGKNKIMSFLFRISLVLVFVAIYVSCSIKADGPFEENDWLSEAIKTEKFIKQAKFQSPEGTAWRVMPDSLNSLSDQTLYSGVPGIVLFYLELYHATGDSDYLEEAKTGAKYLTGKIEEGSFSAGEVGLYTGLAGMSYAILEVFRETKDPYYEEVIINTINLLEASATKSAKGINWAETTDIVYGSAGVGLYLQMVADVLNYSKADSLAILAANGLIDLAIVDQTGWRWEFMPSYDRFMDNFSHGTSGVGYFLSETYLRTNNEKYLKAAIESARLLDSLANEKGYIPHHCPGGEDLYYLNWCHGPAGTSRLYYSLFKATKDKKWLEKIEFTAGQLIDEEIHDQELAGYWNNYGKCCGDAGVAEYYLWLFEITGKQVYLEYSEKLTMHLMSTASYQDNTIKWIHAENRSNPENVAAQTGLMQGSAGIGLWFLQIHAFQKGCEPFIVLPDKPIISRWLYVTYIN